MVDFFKIKHLLSEESQTTKRYMELLWAYAHNSMYRYANSSAIEFENGEVLDSIDAKTAITLRNYIQGYGSNDVYKNTEKNVASVFKSMKSFMLALDLAKRLGY